MRIEAAAYRGKPVYFELIGPWTRPERMQPYQPTAGEQAFAVIGVVLFLSMLVGGAMLARRNLRLGRGIAGELLSGSFCFCGLDGGVALWRAPCPDFAEFGLFIEGLSIGLFDSVSSGFSTLPWSPMCAAAGPRRWSPGAACWREAFGIHWWDAMCLPVVFWGRFQSLLEGRGLFPPGSAILRHNQFGPGVAVSGRAHDNC